MNGMLIAMRAMFSELHLGPFILSLGGVIIYPSAFLTFKPYLYPGHHVFLL